MRLFKRAVLERTTLNTLPSDESKSNPLFDPAFYAKTYRLSLSNGDLYAHYVHTGRFKDFDLNKYFDKSWHLAGSKDVRACGIDPLEHYLAKGAGEGRKPSPAFDGWLYSLLYVDVRASGMNPRLHFLRHGRHEGRFARPTFLLPACGAVPSRDSVAEVDEEC